MSQPSVDDLVAARREYSAGFVTDVEADTLPPGLNEDVIRFVPASPQRQASGLLSGACKPIANGKK